MSQAGDAFQVLAPGGTDPGVSTPGVLVLHSHWGLTDGVRTFCRSLSDQGFTVVAPDLFDGQTATSVEHADQLLAEVDPSRLTVLVQAGARALYAATRDPDAKHAVVGFSMGGSLAYWAGARLPTVFDRSVSYCGLQSIDFAAADGRFLGHFADDDPLVSADDRTYTEALIRMADCETTFHVYDHTRAGFAEPDHPAFDARAARQSFDRTVSFLRN